MDLVDESIREEEKRFWLEGIDPDMKPNAPMPDDVSCCPQCREAGVPYCFANPRSCAFPRATDDPRNTTYFDPDNWNCAALNVLRSEAYDREVWSDDDHAALIPFSEGHLIVAYYKHRGQTEGVLWLHDGETDPATYDQVMRCSREILDRRENKLWFDVGRDVCGQSDEEES